MMAHASKSEKLRLHDNGQHMGTDSSAGRRYEKGI
jgi:hypothetical protein